MSGSRTLLLAIALAVALALIGPSAAPACGCGVMIRATVASEKALVSYHSGQETIVPGLAIDRVRSGAAMVFPVPGRPAVRSLPAGIDVFGELEAATAPKNAQKPGSSSGATAGAPRPSVISHQQLGGYDVTVLKGGSGQTLTAWLRSHKYKLPADSEPILSGYIEQDWYFVAIRLADSRPGEIKPLAIAFPSQTLVYPMQLSRVARAPVSVELYVNANRPASAGIDGLTTTFGGPVSSLRPAPSSAVRALLPASYLTRLESNAVTPASINADYVVNVASLPAPPGKSSSHTWRNIGIIVGAAAIVLALVYGVVRRSRT